MTESMYRRPLVGGAEVDAFSARRDGHKWNHRRRTLIKTGARRRERRSTRQAIQAGRF